MCKDHPGKKPAAMQSKPARKAVGKPPGKGPAQAEKNTDALDKPHKVAGKPHHYNYK